MNRVFMMILILGFSTQINSAEFSIKLRKTEIQDLKQQILPAIEQSIAVASQLQRCLQKNNNVETCLNSIRWPERLDDNEHSQRRDEILQNLQKKVDNKNKAELIAEALDEFLIQSQQLKSCIQDGLTANDIKDCFLKFK
jgi:hypothetical protein